MSSFSLSGGVEVMGFISPTDTNDTYPVIDPLYGVDGFRNVNTLSDLDLIPEPRRRAGMVVGVSGGTDYYKLNSSPWNFDFTDWSVFNTGGSASGYYLPLSGGTVTGNTVFTLGLSVNTISATTYQNLPTDIRVTGGTYSNGTITFTNNSGGTFNVVGLSTGTTINLSGGTGISVSGTSPNFIVENTLPDQIVNLSGGTNIKITGTYPNFGVEFTGTTSGSFTGGTVNGDTIFTQGVTANTLTVNGVFITGDTYTTGGTYSNGIITFDYNTGGVYQVSGLYTGQTSYVNLLTTGVGLSGDSTTGNVTIINTDPDQVVTISGGTGILTGGTYPNFIIQNTLPDQTVVLNNGTNIRVTGTYPNFTIDVTGLTDNNTYTTGFTYQNNTFTISDSSGNTLNATINSVTGLTVNGILSATTISGGTFYGDGSNLTNTPDKYITDLSFNNSNYNLTVTRNDLWSDTVSLGILSSDMTITGGTYDAITGTATFTNNSGGTFNVTGFIVGYTDIRTTGFTYSENTFYITDTSGNTFSASINSVTGLTVNGNLTVSGTTFLKGLSATTIGSSGNCVDDIYVSNIHSCSPLNINPLNEGNVYFGSTSGVTIDLSNKRIGIGTSTPVAPIEIYSNQPNVAIPNQIKFSQAGGNIKFAAYDATISDYFGITLSTSANNRPVRVAGSSGLYVGSTTAVPTPAGSILVEGNVGIGTISPREKLDVSGNTIITGNLTVSGITGTTWFSGNSSSDLVRVTQTGSGNALVVEDSANPDSTPFRIDASGNTAIGVTTSPLSFKLEVNGTSMFRNNMFLNQALFSEVYTYNSVTDSNKVNLSVGRFHDHNDGPVDIGYTAQLGWYKRQSSNISLARSIDIPITFTSGSSGTIGQFNSINTNFQIGEGSTVTTPFVAHAVSATKGTTGTVTSFTGFDVQDNSVSNTTYGFRSRLTSGSGKYGLYFDGTANNYFNGNVGIGTLTPREKLDVSGNTIITGNLTVSGITGTTWFSGNSSSDLVRVTQTGSGNAFVVEDSNNTDSSPFVIDASGNVGIGTTSPSSALNIKTIINSNVGNPGLRVSGSVNYIGMQYDEDLGPVFYTNYVGANNSFLFKGSTYQNLAAIGTDGIFSCNTNGKISNFNSNGYINLWNGVSGDMEVVVATNNGIKFLTNNIEQVRISNTGNVGIGTTTPLTTLHVKGSATSGFDAIRFQSQYPAVGFLGTDNTRAWLSSGTGQTGSYFSVDSAQTRIKSINTTFLNGSNIEIARFGGTMDGFNIGPIATPQARLDVRAQGNLSTDIVFRVRNSADTRNFLVVNGAGDVFSNGAGGVISNTFYGENVGRNNTGTFNTFIGNLAGSTSGTTSDSTFIGYNAGRLHTSGIRNTYVGSEAGSANTNGSQNTFIGRGAGGSIIGSSNTSVGGQSFSFVTTGSNNVTLGSEAGLRISAGTNTITSNNSIFIGFDTRANADSQTNQIVIGHTAIGLGSNTTVIGNTGTTLFRPYGNVAIGADTAGARLDVRAQGVLSTDIAFRVRNSVDTANILSVQGDGTIVIPSNPKIDTTAGTFLQTNANGSLYVGTGNSTISNYTNTVFGNSNTLSNLVDNYVVLGSSNNIAGMRNIAIGIGNKTSGDASIRIGNSIGQDTFGGNYSMHFGRAGGGGFITYSANEVTNFFFDDYRTSQMFRGNGSILLSGKNNQILTDANVTTFMGDGGNTLVVRNHTSVPSLNITDSFQQYSADITAGNAAPHFRTENGSIVKLYQETTGVTTSTLISNAGTTITDTDTFDGYTLQQVVKALRNLGVLQ